MNKKWLLLFAAGGLGLYFFRDKLFGSESTQSSGTPTLLVDRGYAITYPGAPNGGTWLAYQGKRYAFVSEQAFKNFGYTVPVQSTESEVLAMPQAGFVGDDGRVWDDNLKKVILGNAQDK